MHQIGNASVRSWDEWPHLGRQPTSAFSFQYPMMSNSFHENVKCTNELIAPQADEWTHRYFARIRFRRKIA